MGGGDEGKTIVGLNTVILTKVRVQTINDVALPGISYNTLRGDAIRLGDIYVCDVTHNEILETIFSREEFNSNEFFCK